MGGSDSLTDLLQRARGGDDVAFAEVFRIAYADLRQLARARLRSSGGEPLLDTTSLVHESYLRFVRLGQLQVQDRAHFLNYASRVMRSVIVDFVRERLAEKRGGHAPHVTLDTSVSD